MNSMKKKGFTLVELLVVLVIIGVLAAIATPMYLQHIKRARASDAVATMGLLRQAMRDYNINKGYFFTVKEDITNGDIQNQLPANKPTTSDEPGLDVNIGVAQYFSNQAFQVVETPTDSTTLPSPFNAVPFTKDGEPAAVQFVVLSNGKNSKDCGGSIKDNCAINANDVANYRLAMDNSGRVFVCYTADKNNKCETASDWTIY